MSVYRALSNYKSFIYCVECSRNIVLCAIDIWDIFTLTIPVCVSEYISMIAVIRLGQTLGLNRGRKRMLDASNLAQTCICVTQTRIWVKVARKKMETRGQRGKRMITDATAKIADRDTPAWPIPCSPGVGQEANLANCLRKTPSHVSVLFWESPALLLSVCKFFASSSLRHEDCRIIPIFERYGWCKWEFRRRLIVILEELSYLVEWISNERS